MAPPQTSASAQAFLPATITLQANDALYGGKPLGLEITSGLTVLVGPNGGGKTQVLRGLATALRTVAPFAGEKVGKVKLLAAGRSGPLETFRANIDNPYHSTGNPAAIGNQSYRGNWWQYESVTGDFLTLMDRADLRLKLEARLQGFYAKSLRLEWTQSGLQIGFVPLTGGRIYYANVEASGLLQLIPLLASIYNDEVGALLIDEPEISLHPQLQAFLLQEILAFAGDPLTERGRKLIILATHSTSMLPIRRVEDVPKLVFFSDRHTFPVQVPPSAGELKSRKLGALIARMSETHKTAFFARTALLVEGPSDEIVVSSLAHLLSHSLLGNNAQVVPVTGKGEFPEVIKLFRLMAKRTVVACDLDAVADGNEVVAMFSNTSEGQVVANAMGAASLLDLDRAVRTDLNRLAAAAWDHIAKFAIQHPYWACKNSETPEEIAKRRAVLASVLSRDEAELRSLGNGPEWVSIKARFGALLDALEKTGCFVLRRGTIEDYYLRAVAPDIAKKPEAAAAEAVAWEAMCKSVIAERYLDIIRAMHFAAPIQRIDENDLLREKLGAALGALFQSMQLQMPDVELNSRAEATLGADAAIFRLENKSKDGRKRIRVSMASNLFLRDSFPFEIDETENLTTVIRGKLPPIS